MRRAMIAILFLIATSNVSGQVSSRIIEGEVRLSNGRVAEMGVYVSLESDASGGFITTQTDSRGKFTFSGLAPTRFRIRVKSPGYFDEAQEVDLSIQTFALLHFTLREKPGTTPGSEPITGVVSAKHPDFPPDMPEEARHEFEEGFAIFTSGKSQDKSISHFKKSAEKYDKFASSYYYLGSAYAIQQKYDDAIPALKKSLELNPKAPEALIALGAIYNRQKNYPEAEKLLTQAVELSPDSFDAHEELAKAIMPTLQRTPEAEQHLEKAVALDPKSVEAHILLGNMLLRKRDNDGALVHYREALRLDPKGPMAAPVKQMVQKLETTQKANKF